MRSAVYSVHRDIPQDLCEHLEQLASASCTDDKPICPLLFVMEKKQYHNEWSKVRTILKLNKSRSLTALTWPWKEAHPDLRDMEIALNHITALENKWLSPAELEVTRKLQVLPALTPNPTGK